VQADLGGKSATRGAETQAHTVSNGLTKNVKKLDTWVSGLGRGYFHFCKLGSGISPIGSPIFKLCPFQATFVGVRLLLAPAPLEVVTRMAFGAEDARVKQAAIGPISDVMEFEVFLPAALLAAELRPR
jgi:hypothetical protein